METLMRSTGFAFVGLALGASGCNELQKIDDGGSSAAGIPDEVQRVFDERCNTAGCHDAARAGGLELTADAAPEIIGGGSVQSSLPLVDLGNVQGSYLAIKLLPDSELLQGAPMPLGASLDDAAVAIDSAIILGWIAGASLPGGGDGADTEGAETTGDGMESSGDGMETTGSDVALCSLEVIAPGEANPFDIGMDAGQIPPDVGAALTANCGCHEVDSGAVIEGAPPYGGQVSFSTIAELQADYMGRPVYEVVQERLESEDFSQMPPNYYCDLGDGTPITAEDQMLLIEWLMAGAPDAPSWNPG